MSNDILKQIDLIDRQLAELRIAVRQEQGREQTVPERDPDYIPVMLTLNQASEKTGLSYDYLRKLCLQGRIVCVRAGNRYLINQEKLVAFLNGEDETGRQAVNG